MQGAWRGGADTYRRPPRTHARVCRRASRRPSAPVESDHATPSRRCHGRSPYALDCARRRLRPAHQSVRPAPEWKARQVQKRPRRSRKEHCRSARSRLHDGPVPAPPGPGCSPAGRVPPLRGPPCTPAEKAGSASQERRAGARRAQDEPTDAVRVRQDVQPRGPTLKPRRPAAHE